MCGNKGNEDSFFQNNSSSLKVETFTKNGEIVNDPNDPYILMLAGVPDGVNANTAILFANNASLLDGNALGEYPLLAQNVEPKTQKPTAQTQSGISLATSSSGSSSSTTTNANNETSSNDLIAPAGYEEYLGTDGKPLYIKREYKDSVVLFNKTEGIKLKSNDPNKIIKTEAKVSNPEMVFSFIDGKDKYIANFNVKTGDFTGYVNAQEKKYSNPDAVEKLQLKDQNKTFFADVNKFIDEEITKTENLIKNKKEKYDKNKWAIPENEFKPQEDKITNLKLYKSYLKEIENTVLATGGDKLLTLMNVVYNEAGALKYNDDARKAVAHAYLNRIKYEEGGDVREPKGAEISDYQELSKRWNSYAENGKLEFLKNIKSSFDASYEVYSSDREDDPTNGATHWVSPISLKRSRKSTEPYYKRTYDGIETYFPNWARSNEWTKDEKNKSAAKSMYYSIDDYEEITVPNVEGKYFLFYKGVR